MTAISKGNGDAIAKLTPGGGLGLAHLSDDDLLANTRRLVGRTNQLLAALLVHLAEVEARGVHRTRRCASLYTYCIYELRFSEDAAARRSAAARFVKQFPLLFTAIADGELHLTGLLMIGPHLTPENHVEVLGRAKFRTKKELGKLLRDLNPLPQVPDLIEPLGPPQLRALRNPTWEEYVTSLAPPVRELPAEERPSDWAREADLGTHLAAEVSGGGVVTHRQSAAGDGGNPGETARTAQHEPLPVGPVPKGLPPVTGPQHYQVQFCAVEEHAQLVERAEALLARSRPGMTLGELHLEAMKLLVASLEKRKFGSDDRPQGGAKTSRKTKAAPRRDQGPSAPPAHQREEPEARELEAGRLETGAIPRRGGSQMFEHETGAAPRQRVGWQTFAPETGATPRQRGAETGEGGERSEGNQGRLRLEKDEGVAATCRRARRDCSPSKPSRYIPAAERREVYQRDAGRCTYVDARGERCCETRYLELHHLQPFANRGASVAANLALRCAAHNALAAEEDFGARHMSERREATKHEALAAQQIVGPKTSN